MKISGLQILVIASLGFLVSCSCSINAITVEYDSNAVVINGERKLIFAGAIHYPRSTPEMWPDLIKKAKEGGLNAIETYVFWDQHEPRRRQYDFSGNLDFIRFFKVVQETGLYVILRVGPYVCAEWNYGGFPMWLHNTPGIELRTNNEIYKNEMQIFTTKIVNMCKEAKLFAPQGGPIILAQIENEYGNIMKGYGEAGKEYVKWCAKMAVAQNIGVPWIMCQQKDAPQPMINTCNGFYCDNFTPNNPKSPKMFTENWTGWFKKWGGKDPYRPAEDLAFSVARFFQTGGVLNNYYMYHGGTNFGRTAGGPYYVTSYDYNAPLDEYGNLNQPKWGHLKKLHEAIRLGEKMLTTIKAATKQFGNGVDLTMYANNATGERFCFLSNQNEKQDANIDLQKDGKYFLPAWSVSILQNCNKEIYNTAKITAQTYLMIKTQPELFTAFSEDPPKFNWTWAPEPMIDTLQGKGTFRASELLDQKEATIDTSDYLWYITSVNINETSGENVTLHVTTRGHVLHAYVNEKLIGSQFSKEANSAQTVKGDDYSFVFERPVSLKSGTNTIALLSATVGLANYGEFFDKKPTGVAGGPVKLVVNGSTAMDLSSNVWSYKVGLNGEAKQFYDPESENQWKASGLLPTGQPMIWYKTSFKTPIGILPVVMDLKGMGKGHAWVNGKSIGRYWPTQIADAKGCSNKCDYRGWYNGGKCVTNCGNPSQRWYHVPRSFLNNGTNTLVLFEEVGGNPSNVTTEIVKVATVCGVAEEGTTMELACQETQAVSQIGFATLQNPQGTCGDFSGGSMEDSINLSQTILNECYGKSPCFFNVTEATLKVTNLGGKKLTVQAQC